MKKTFLFAEHEKLGAKLVNFHGWSLPLNYEGALQEHLHVREHVGLFDISHMGRVFIEGLEAKDFLEAVCTNSIKDMARDQIRYTVLTDVDGYSIDDILVYRHQENHFACIVNGANREKDLAFFKEHAKNFEVNVKEHFEKQGIIAMQGPSSSKVLEPFFSVVKELKPMCGALCTYQGKELYLSRTGYTGELGFELYGPEEELKTLWQELLNSKEASVKPIGLAARDSLRLEMGFVLYGNDLTTDIYANESLARWTVKWKKESFLGKQALEKVEESSKRRRAYGIEIQGNAIARSGMSVYVNQEKRGVVTSGGYSPMLKKPIALILVAAQLTENDLITVEVRNKHVEAKAVKLPFYKK